MYERLRKLYELHRINAIGVYYWVTVGAITMKQYNDIVGEESEIDSL